jgi:hypothetical protein
MGCYYKNMMYRKWFFYFIFCKKNYDLTCATCTGTMTGDDAAIFDVWIQPSNYAIEHRSAGRCNNLYERLVFTADETQVCVSGSCAFNRRIIVRAGCHTEQYLSVFKFAFAMPSTRSNPLANGTAALVDHDILSRVRKLEGTVSSLLRKMRNQGKNGVDGGKGRDGAPGVDGANGRDGAPGVDGANGRDGAPGVDGANGRDGAPGVDGASGRDGGLVLYDANERHVQNGQGKNSEVDCTNSQEVASGGSEADVLVDCHPDQAAGHLEEGDCLLMAPDLNVPSHRVVVRVIGPSASGLQFSFSMKRRNTFTPLKRYVATKLGLGQAFNVSLAYEGHPLSSGATPESIGVQTSHKEMSLTFAVK